VPWYQAPGTVVFADQGLYTLSNGPDFEPNQTSVSTRYLAPAEPAQAGAACDGGSTSDAVLSWFPVPGVDGYHIYDLTSGQPALIATVAGAGSQTYTVPNLTAGTSYTWSVQSFTTSGGDSGPASQDATPPFDPGSCAAPPAPSILASELCSGTAAGAHLTWDRPASAEPVVQYVIRANRFGLRWTLQEEGGSWRVTGPGGDVSAWAGDPTAPSLDVAGLNNVQQWTFTVQAFTTTDPSPGPGQTSPVSNPSNAITPTCGAGG